MSRCSNHLKTPKESTTTVSQAKELHQRTTWLAKNLLGTSRLDIGTATLNCSPRARESSRTWNISNGLTAESFWKIWKFKMRSALRRQPWIEKRLIVLNLTAYEASARPRVHLLQHGFIFSKFAPKVANHSSHLHSKDSNHIQEVVWYDISKYCEWNQRSCKVYKKECY